MKQFISLLIIILSSINNLFAQDDLMKELENLINTEKAFAKMATTHNTVKAFYHFLADDGIVFNPEIVNGKELYKTAKANESQLIWRPVYADISKSGDLGLSTGPFEFKNKKGEKSIAFGHFVSIWEKQPSNEWRNVIDIGISHEYYTSYPDDCEYPIELEKIKTVQNSSTNDKTNSKEELLELEDEFIQGLKSDGIIETYQKYSDKKMKLYRNNHLPVTGIDEAIKLLDSKEDIINSKTEGVKTSSIGDFGFTYGVMIQKGKDEISNTVRSSFLRVWKKNNSDKWMIILDLTKPIPSDNN